MNSSVTKDDRATIPVASDVAELQGATKQAPPIARSNQPGATNNTREIGSARSHRRLWARRYITGLVMSDLSAGVLGTYVAIVLCLPAGPVRLADLLAAVLMPFGWVLLIAVNHGYARRNIGVGSDEYRLVSRAVLGLFAGVAITSFVTGTDVSRGFVLVATPVTFSSALVGRYAARKVLHRRRANGKSLTRVLLVGDGSSILEFTRLLHRDIYAGLKVVGACLPAGFLQDGPMAAACEAYDVPILGDVDSLLAALDESAADTVAVVTSSDVGTQKLRWISWQLEGLPTDLVVVPGLVEVAGTRLHIQPVNGLPLLHVDEPRFTGFARMLKATFDRAIAVTSLVLMAPFLLLVAVAVRLDSSGPALFRQTRVGLNGEFFTMHKFRSMYVDAEARLAEVVHHNQHDETHVLFKIRNDPRVTRVGKWLRRLSIDELPQLIDVAAGRMSLVGPRPPLPAEVEKYEEHVHRRLLVKPGLTGLWQVSGRSDLAWDECVRLDLRYVENWSLAGDLLILWKTLFAVMRRRGAY